MYMNAEARDWLDAIWLCKVGDIKTVYNKRLRLTGGPSIWVIAGRHTYKHLMRGIVALPRSPGKADIDGEEPQEASAEWRSMPFLPVCLEFCK